MRRYIGHAAEGLIASLLLCRFDPQNHPNHLAVPCPCHTRVPTVSVVPPRHTYLRFSTRQHPAPLFLRSFDLGCEAHRGKRPLFRQRSANVVVPDIPADRKKRARCNAQKEVQV